MFRTASAAILLFAGLTHGALAADEYMAVFTKTGSFDDVRDAVEMAIIDRGMVVNNVSRVGEMLERTGKDLGETRHIFLKAEILEFCSATMSRKMMGADPDNIDALAVHLQSTNTRRARFSGPMLNPHPGDKMHEYLPRVRTRGRITGISGREDQAAKLVMDKQEAALQAIQPGARFHIIENAGHWVQYEAAERFNEILLDALSAKRC